MPQLKPGEKLIVSNDDGIVNYEVTGGSGTVPIDPPPTTEWVTIGREGDDITITEPTIVRFGDPVSNQWSAEKQVTQSFNANSTFFGGDPAYGVAKVVQKKTGGTVVTPPIDPPGEPTHLPADPSVFTDFNSADTLAFFYGGQSNATPRNGNTEVNNDQNILEFRTKTFAKKADGTDDVSTPLTFELVQLNDPTGAGYTYAGSSSFTRMLRQIAAKTGKRIVLIKTAQGNSGISQHLPDDGKNAANPDPHNIHYVSKQLATNFYSEASAKGWKVFSIGSFWQGESDAAWGTPDETYFTKFDQVMHLYQSDYGCKAMFVIRVGYDLSGPWPASNSEKIMALQSLYCLINSSNTIEATKAVSGFTVANGLMSGDKVHVSGNGQDIVSDKVALSVTNYLLKGEKTFEPETVPGLAAKYNDPGTQAKYKAMLIEPSHAPIDPPPGPIETPPISTATAIDIDFTKGVPSNLKAVNTATGKDATAVTNTEGLVLDQSYHLILPEVIASNKITVEITCKCVTANGGLGFILGGKDLTGGYNRDKIRVDIGEKKIQFGPGVLSGQDLGVDFIAANVNFSNMNIYKFSYDNTKVDVSISDTNGLVLFSGSKPLSGALLSVGRIGAGHPSFDTNFKGTIKHVKVSTF
jgi:hypothetical protein